MTMPLDEDWPDIQTARPVDQVAGTVRCPACKTVLAQVAEPLEVMAAIDCDGDVWLKRADDIWACVSTQMDDTLSESELLQTWQPLTMLAKVSVYLGIGDAPR